MKKRILLSLLASALLASGLAVSGTALTEDRFGDSHEAYCERLYGDVNLDWQVDAVDYLLVKRCVLGTVSLIVKQEQQAADVNRDGAIDEVDYLLIKRAILGTFTLPGIIVEELTPNLYASYTDEELYALIDEELESDPEPEGRNILTFSFKRIKRESQASAVLEELGFSGDLNDETVYRLHYGADMFLSVYMEVPPEQLREAMFKLRRCDEIGGCHIHGDQYEYAD